MAAALRREHFEQDSEGDDSDTDDSHRALDRQLGLPHIPELLLVPRRIQADDEHDLRWFLNEPLLSSIRGSSDFGAQLARAESYGFGALPCRACGGRWSRRTVDEEGREVITGWKDGTGWKPKKHFGKQESYAQALARYRLKMRHEKKIVIVSHHPHDPATRSAVAAAFKERREVAMTEAELRAAYPSLPTPGDDDYQEWSEPCKACKGLGVVERQIPRRAPVTVWPTGSSKRPGAREAVGADELVARAVQKGTAVWDGYSGVSLQLLERFLSVELVLRDVAGLSAPGRAILERYYGPGLVAVRTAKGRIPKARRRAVGYQALYELTSVGTKSEATEEEKSQRAREVAALYSHACGVFNLVSYGVGQ